MERLTGLIVLAALVAGGVVGGAAWAARGVLTRARAAARALLQDAAADAENKKKEILVAAEEKLLAAQADADERERVLDEREARVEQRGRELERRVSEAGRERARLDRSLEEAKRVDAAAARAAAEAREARERALGELDRVAGLSREQARREIIASIEAEARAEGERLGRRIEEQARDGAERQAVQLLIRAAERANVRDVVETTVRYVELPSDEMKGRIIGREGRNIRALEMATGIDLVVDDTPRSILISSFDPQRREVARLAIDRLVEDGRIHPARIEEVVQKVQEEIESVVEQRGQEAAFGLGISDVHPRLLKLIGRMRFHYWHGQNLLIHCRDTARIAAHMAHEVGARADVALRAGLLHEIGQVEDGVQGHPILVAADLCAKYGEADEVVRAIRSLHAESDERSLEGTLVQTARRISEARPGARKDNLAVFLERLRRLEDLARRFDGVERAFAVKAGKELRVLVDATRVDDERTLALSKEIARAIERELAYPGPVKVTLIRETRAVRYAV
jgi:ribonucrease Y